MAEAALDAMLARIAAARVQGYGLMLERRDAPGEGWIEARELVRDDGPLDEIVAAAARGANTTLAKVGAEWLLELYAWLGTSLVGAALVSEARVPDLTPDNVMVGIHEGRPWGLALRGGRLIGLPGDPEVEVVPDEAALARAAHDTLTAHVEPLVEALVARRLRPRKALWRAAGDRVGQGFLWAANAYDASERSARLAELVIAAPSPMHVPLAVEVGEDGVPYHVRSTCCLNHRTDDPMLCPGCPLWNSRRYVNTAG